jgi:AraC family L-rhamnose operon transcriptional activator RhaR
LTSPDPPISGPPQLSRQQFVGSDRLIAAWRVSDAADDRLHSHDFHELQLVLSGSAVHHEPTARRRVGPGSVLLLRPGTLHAYHRCRALDVVVICVAPELLRGDLAGMMADPALHMLLRRHGPGLAARHGRLPAGRVTSLRPVLERLVACRGEDWAATRVEQVGLLLIVLAAVARSLDGPAPAGPGSLVHPAVATAAADLEAHPQRPWTLADLADRVHLDPAYLSRLFKQHTGLPPMRYLAQRRVEHAASLLRSDLSIQQVAALAGWPEPSYFARRFKAATGLTPSAYRHSLIHT